jgi:histone H3/H4
MEDLRWQPTALSALQEASKSVLIQVFEGIFSLHAISSMANVFSAIQLFAIHACRVTIMLKDVCGSPTADDDLP